MIRLSNSSVEKYEQCGEKWRLHYKEKIRADFAPSPLFYGSALDEAFNRLLLVKKKELTEDESIMMKSTAYEILQAMAKEL